MDLIGKGKGNRVFDHVNDELKFSTPVDDNKFTEDEVSAKINTIRDIRHVGLNVIHIIHRYGLTEKEAMEVEAALMTTPSESPIYNPDMMQTEASLKHKHLSTN